MKRKGKVFFDLDGTLLCSHIHIGHALRRVCEELGYAKIPDSAVIKQIGATSEEFCKALAPDEKVRDRFATLFRQYERQAVCEHAALYPGVRELLSELPDLGWELAICSSGSVEYIETALKGGQIQGFFSSIVSAREYGGKAEALRENLEVGIPTVVVGDRALDFMAAANMQVPSIGVEYGYGTEEEWDQATWTAKAPAEIGDILCQAQVFYTVEERLEMAHGRCVGVNGVDTAGKTIFAQRLAAFLKSRGKKVELIHLDDFHNPRQKRLTGKDEREAYIKNAFDLDRLNRSILLPLREAGEVHTSLTLLDLDSDTYSIQRQYDIDADTYVILEGVLLYRPPLEANIDYKVYLDIDFDEVLRRAEIRDVPQYGRGFLQKYREKYIPIQQWYIETYRPHDMADLVVVNQNYRRPVILEQEKEEQEK